MYWAVFGDLERAREEYDIAVENADPGDPTAYSLRGWFYLQTEQYGLCVEDYNIRVELEPDDPWGYLERGDCYIGLGDVDRARADYSTFLEMTSDVPEFFPEHERVEAWLSSN